MALAAWKKLELDVKLKKLQPRKRFNDFVDTIVDFLDNTDGIPWCDPDIIIGCERDVVEATKNGSYEQKNDCIMRLSWALVHSRKPEDVKRGIAMLEASLTNTSSPLQQREKIYLLAVGYYRSSDYLRSLELVKQCLEIEDDWRQALSLKAAVEKRLTKDGVIGIGITAAAVGLLTGGMIAAIVHRF